jgi:hypothetical protein
MTPEIRLGTSAFSANGWLGAFYPRGMKTADYLKFYSTRFDTVEGEFQLLPLPGNRSRQMGNENSAWFHLLVEHSAHDSAR